MKKTLLLNSIIVLSSVLFLSFNPRKEKKMIVSGTIVPELAAVDSTVIAFMTKWKIPSGSVALVKEGRLIYAKGFGFAEPNVPTQPDHLYRIASLSKPITAVAIMKLVELEKISLDQKVFGSTGILNNTPYLTITDPRIKEITIQHLLQHSAGWDRQTSTCGDPMFNPLTIAQCMKAASPANPETVIRYMLTKPLDFNPGTQYAYSNFGYTILGRIIEKVTGLNYEEYVKKNILTPSGIKNMTTGKNRICDKMPNEVSYYDYSQRTVNSVCEPGNTVSFPYGGFNLEAMDAHGGWIASATDLARFLTALDNSNTESNILQEKTIKAMLEPSPVKAGYSNGWFVNSKGNRWHTGCLIGSSAMMAQLKDGTSWVLLFNAYPKSDKYFAEMDRLMWNALSKTKRLPVHDLFKKTQSNNTQSYRKELPSNLL